MEKKTKIIVGVVIALVAIVTAVVLFMGSNVLTSMYGWETFKTMCWKCNRFNQADDPEQSCYNWNNCSGNERCEDNCDDFVENCQDDCSIEF